MTTLWAIVAIALAITLTFLVMRMRPAQHEADLRTNARVALELPVHLRVGHQGLDVVSSDISRGGLRLRARVTASAGQPVELAFTLPGQEKMVLYGVVRWCKDDAVGILFDPRDPSRPLLLEWLDAQVRERVNA